MPPAIFCVGDSQTAGFGGARAYPDALRDLLGMMPEDDVRCAGIGWTAADARAALPHTLESLQKTRTTFFDAAIVALGFNDVCTATPLAAFQDHSAEALRLAAFSTGKPHPERLLVMSIVPVDATPFVRFPEAYANFTKGLETIHQQGGHDYLAFRRDSTPLAQRVGAYNQCLQTLCHEHGYGYLDITTPLRTLVEEAEQPAAYFLSGDGVHLAGAALESVVPRILDAHATLPSWEALGAFCSNKPHR